MRRNPGNLRENLRNYPPNACWTTPGDEADTDAGLLENGSSRMVESMQNKIASFRTREADLRLIPFSRREIFPRSLEAFPRSLEAFPRSLEAFKDDESCQTNSQSCLRTFPVAALLNGTY
ncbi:hypothetical protein BV898_18703 [Hypsibius exemplaris]|uniref:Uncharacterized protein n=1 Tax=Hypsibius exemplaris TaxID=2072580 RepID=A0A9X6NI16_HYPEX|nr:hypothetical protein BV898_18703 [Hypsibius exemplaris]